MGPLILPAAIAYGNSEDTGAMRRTLLGLMMLLSACAAKTPKPNDAPSGIDLNVVLLEPGAEPREQVRYHGASGKSERLLLRLSLANFIETRAGAALAAAPVLDLVLHVGATYRSEVQGVWGYPMRMDMIGVNGAEQLDEQAKAALLAELAPISQVRGIFEVDDRGITHNAELSIPPGASPRLLTLLGNVRTTLLAAALPHEPIGVGARWQADRVIKVGQMTVPQTVTYTLLDREDDVLRLGVSVHQSAKPQEFPLGLDGSMFHLEAYEVSAVGSAVVDLHGLAPLSELHALSQLRATISRAGQVEPVAMNGDLTIQIAPLPSSVQVQAPVDSAAPDASDAPAAQPGPGA
jgi:hypothetical protein